jgi:Transposase IS116/IS110/IS902 family
VDAQIKLSVVASDSFGVSGRAMLAALVAGERDPKRLAQLARTRLRPKLGQLEEAFCGRFSDHHAFLLKTMLSRIDQASADIAALDRKIEEIAPFQAAVDRLDAVTGVGRTAAQVIIAEIGTDMGRCPTPAHLACWARFAPGVKQSAGRTNGKATTGHGSPYLAWVLGEAAVAAGRTDTFPGERYRRMEPAAYPAPIDPPGPGSAALRRVPPRADAPWIFGSASTGPAQSVTALACQKFARNYPTRGLTTPHDTALGSTSHLPNCVGT